MVVCVGTRERERVAGPDYVVFSARSMLSTDGKSSSLEPIRISIPVMASREINIRL